MLILFEKNYLVLKEVWSHVFHCKQLQIVDIYVCKVDTSIYVELTYHRQGVVRCLVS